MHLAKKGVQLKHAKLTPDQVITIRSTVKQRLNLLKYIRDNLSNEATKKQYGVSENTLTRVVQFKAYGHIV